MLPILEGKGGIWVKFGSNEVINDLVGGRVNGAVGVKGVPVEF